MARRNDAKLVHNIPMYKKIFPYIMKRRCDNLVYHTVQMNLTQVTKFIKEHAKENPEMRKYRVFEVFIAALMRTIALRPELNRFISKNQYWQRNDLSINFVVKEDYTDESPEHSTPIYFDPSMTLDEIANIINTRIVEARTSNDFTDDTIKTLFLMPKFLIRFVVFILRLLDINGKAPKWLRDADGLHTTVFISSLGSIGLPGGSPFHHLYEWGTTSIFLTMGKLNRSHSIIDEKKTHKDTMDIGVTVDERICDGFYFMNSFRIFQDILNNPKVLLERPELKVVPVTKREHKRFNKEQKKLDETIA